MQRPFATDNFYFATGNSAAARASASAFASRARTPFFAAPPPPLASTVRRTYSVTSDVSRASELWLLPRVHHAPETRLAAARPRPAALLDTRSHHVCRAQCQPDGVRCAPGTPCIRAAACCYHVCTACRWLPRSPGVPRHTAQGALRDDYTLTQLEGEEDLVGAGKPEPIDSLEVFGASLCPCSRCVACTMSGWHSVWLTGARV